MDYNFIDSITNSIFMMQRYMVGFIVLAMLLTMLNIFLRVILSGYMGYAGSAVASIVTFAIGLIVLLNYDTTLIAAYNLAMKFAGNGNSLGGVEKAFDFDSVTSGLNDVFNRALSF